MVSLVGGSMAKRVLLVRGGSLGRNTGLGAAHHNLVDMLETGKIAGWELAGICEYPLSITSNPISRIWHRWFSHPKRVARQIKKLAEAKDCDLVHITDQEQAHLVPKNSQLPVVITIHDLFHMFPEQLQFGNDVVDIGDVSPGIIRSRDLKKLKHGVTRASNLICISKHTLNAAKGKLPKCNVNLHSFGDRFSEISSR
jgi:hypothetical protein